MSEQSASSLQRPAIVGHRGASAHAPENTLAAFRRGIEDGAQVLECDVHLSADGHVVVMHDETIDRTAAAGLPSSHRARSVTSPAPSWTPCCSRMVRRCPRSRSCWR